LKITKLYARAGTGRSVRRKLGWKVGIHPAKPYKHRGRKWALMSRQGLKKSLCDTRSANGQEVKSRGKGKWRQARELGGD